MDPGGRAGNGPTFSALRSNEWAKGILCQSGWHHRQVLSLVLPSVEGGAGLFLIPPIFNEKESGATWNTSFPSVCRA